MRCFLSWWSSYNPFGANSCVTVGCGRAPSLWLKAVPEGAALQLSSNEMLSEEPLWGSGHGHTQKGKDVNANSRDGPSPAIHPCPSAGALGAPTSREVARDGFNQPVQ